MVERLPPEVDLGPQQLGRWAAPWNARHAVAGLAPPQACALPLHRHVPEHLPVPGELLDELLQQRFLEPTHDELRDPDRVLVVR